MELIIYEKGPIKVYINQSITKGKKTSIYAIRKDDYTGKAILLGLIKWDGLWRQYVLEPEIAWETRWSAGCLQEIVDFLTEINAMQRMRIKKKK